MKIFCVYDVKAKYYQTPWFQPTNVHANRIFTSEVNRAAADNLLYNHYKDFELYELGTWDESTGALLTDNPPTLVTSGLKVRSEPEQE